MAKMDSPGEKKGSLTVLNGLPDQPGSTGPKRWQVFGVHLFRVLLFAAILLLIRQHHLHVERLRIEQDLAPDVSFDWVRGVLPAAGRVADWQTDGSAKILDSSEKKLGRLIHTVSESREVIGYIGSTVLLILLGNEEEIKAVLVYESHDTPEHVSAIIRDPHFLYQWQGLDTEQAAEKEDVDVVSGATLTSLAIVESLRQRLGRSDGGPKSLKFPQELMVEELQGFWESAVGFQETEKSGWYSVVDSAGASIGFFLRSSPIADNVIGYQGPTDCLFLFDSERQFLRTVIRSSFDNSEPEPFVDYVRDDDYFLAEQFQGLSIPELAAYDEEEVEGVSGATMTSSGVFLSLQLAAQEFLRSAEVRDSINQAQEPRQLGDWQINARDWGTLLILLSALLVTFTRLKRTGPYRWLHRAFLVVYLGFMNGDMLSQTLLVGWVQNGIPKQHVVGLVTLSLVALLVPMVTKRNIYCEAICPFGAAQMFAGRVLRRKPKTPRLVNRIGKWIPATLVILASIVALGWMEWNLAGIEPFDAFHWRIAGWATLTIALIGIVTALWVPMAYCRWGCPTGAILKYLRFNARSDRLGFADALSLLVLVMAAATYLSNWA